MKKQIMRGIVDWFKDKANYFILGVMFIVVVIMQYGILTKEEPVREVHQNKVGWQETFDLKSIPSGLVVWSHGVPGMEADFKHSPIESTRYYYFDLAILTKDKIIHVVRVPYYVVGLLNPNGKIDFKGELKNKRKSRNILDS